MLGVAATDDNVGSADPYLERTGKEALANHLDAIAALQAERHEPTTDVGFSPDCGN